MAEPTLKKGSKGQSVKDLQEALKELGLAPGPIDGVFGTKTQDAVKAFQKLKDLPVDGVAGALTWLNIDEADQTEPLLKLGSKGLPVRRLQHRMKLTGFAIPDVDGRYDATTAAAVKTLQGQAGLVVDGVVGPKTWAVVDALKDEGDAR